MHEILNHIFCCVEWPSTLRADLAYQRQRARFLAKDQKSYYNDEIVVHLQGTYSYDHLQGTYSCDHLKGTYAYDHIRPYLCE